MPDSSSMRPVAALIDAYFRRRVLRQLAIYLALMLALVWGLVAM